MPTPNRGYIYPATSSPATVPADIQAPLEQIDADVQQLVDSIENIDALPAGMAIPFFDRALADAYQAAHPGAPVLWIDTTDPTQYYPAAPSRDLIAASYTIPADPGATYRVDGVSVGAGTYRITFPEGVELVTVEVEAFPAAGYEFAFDAVASWTFAFEPAPVLYDGAASGAPVYLRLDDAVGTQLPRNRGTGSYTTYNNITPKLAYGKASVGTGATSAANPGTGTDFYLPYTRPLSGTVAVVYQFDAPMGPEMTGGTRSISIGKSWGDATGWSVPAVDIKADNGAWMQVICWLGYGGNNVRNGNDPAVSEWADGTDRTHIAYTWDAQAGTVKFFVNGEVYWSSDYAPPADGPAGGSRAVNILSNLNGARVGGLVWDFTRAWTDQEVSDLSEAVAR